MNQLIDAIWEATVLCLGLDPASTPAQDRVRKSWPNGETGSTNWPRDRNIVFLRVSPYRDPYGELRDVAHRYDSATDSQVEVVRYHRCWQIMWVCYGPDADSDADAIRIGILRDAVHGFLAQYGIAVKPHINEPMRMPEQDETGEWWERCDLTAECYQLVSREYPEDIITVPPEITIAER